MSNPFQTEELTRDGLTVRIEYFYDDDSSPPWKRADGHGSIREVYAYYSRPEKRPGEIVIHSNRGNHWLYNFAGAVDKAKREGWCTACEWAKGLTKGQIAERAARQDMEFHQSWLNDDWHYAGVVVTLLDDDGEETDISDSCWGFETFNDYHETAAKEMAEALITGELKRRAIEAEKAEAEAIERDYWASRDVATIGD